MTTFQDPPLQSRRAARQGERNAAYGQQPDEAAEPLTYTTQNRAALPQYGGPDFRVRRTPEAPDGEPAEQSTSGVDDGRTDSGQPATEMLPRQDVPSYRPRDFSPEGRRSRPMPSSVPESADGIEYHTQNLQPLVQPPAPVAAEQAAPAAPVFPVEHTMTRRELRALREAQGANVMVPRVEAVVAAPAPAADATPASESAETAESAAPAADAAPTEVSSAEATEAPAAAPELSPFEALFAAPSTQAAPNAQAFAPDPIAPAGPQAAAETPATETSAAETPSAEAVAEPVPAAPEPPVAEARTVEVSESEAPIPAREPVTPPAPAAGHWTTQGDLDDATQVADTITRSVGAGSGVITTSALVLPTLPNPEYSQLGTGDILVTGSIDLPRSLATSGAHPAQLDEHHLDHELDPGDRQVVSTDSQPVRAIKAISSHSSTRDVIASRKPSGNRALTALIISAAAMAAVVVTLLVVGLVTRVL